MAIKLNTGQTVQSSASESTSKTVWFNRDIELFGNSFGPKKKERFYLDLRTLIAADVDLRTALEIIIEEQSKIKDKQLFETIYKAILKGKSLSEGLLETGKFSEYEYFCIQVGEEANKLPDVLDELIKYYEERIALKKQITSVLSYPLFVLAITVGLVYFMMTSVVPMFADVFKQFGSELPQLTQNVIYFSENFLKFFLIFLAVTCSIFIFVRSQRSKIWFRNYTSFVILKIPIVGKLVSTIYLARFTQSLHLLLSSKTPLIKSLKLTHDLVKFYPIQAALNQVQNDIQKGKSIHEGLKTYKIFPKRMLSLIKVGEQVNQLDIMLGKLSNQYSTELRYQTTIIGKIMEPLILLIIGGIVGVILVAMYMPMFNLSNIMTQ